jgi:predicted DNA-binding transcriptional regulator AlpA
MTKVIRLAELASTSKKPGLLPVSPSTIWRWVREKKFPAPIKLGERTTVWDAQAVDAFITGRAKEAEE